MPYQNIESIRVSLVAVLSFIASVLFCSGVSKILMFWFAAGNLLEAALPYAEVFIIVGFAILFLAFFCSIHAILGVNQK